MKGERDTLPAIPHIRIAITCRIDDGLHNLCMYKLGSTTQFLNVGRHRD